MDRAYIGARLKNDLRLRGIRDEIYNSMGCSDNYRGVSPHITVIPPFKINEEDKRELKQVVNSSSLHGQEVSVNRLSVWKNIHKPRVILLNVDVDIEDERNRLLGELQSMDTKIMSDPVNPHITLFKSNNVSKYHSRDEKETIQREILARKRFPDTEVLDVYVEFKEY